MTENRKSRRLFDQKRGQWVHFVHDDEVKLQPAEPGYTLMDDRTSDPIGPATAEQVEASLASDERGEYGLILIDAAGVVVYDGTWEAQQPGVRTVYVL